eukprot:scaffold1284_cov402-Pavlova_lutheri.AAC.3
MASRMTARMAIRSSSLMPPTATYPTYSTAKSSYYFRNRLRSSAHPTRDGIESIAPLLVGVVHTSQRASSLFEEGGPLTPL